MLRADPTQFRLRNEGPDVFILVCLICFEPFADDNTHAEIRIHDKHPRLDQIVDAVNNHQHGREPEL
jgi:hypothetical protein